MKTIQKLCELTRQSLLPGVDRDKNGLPIFAGNCLYASFILSELLERFGDCSYVKIRGGDGDEHGGALGKDGEWWGHYWVECEKNGERFIADVTADQFGHEPIVLGAMSTLNHRYKNDPEQHYVEEAVMDLHAMFTFTGLSLKDKKLYLKNNKIILQTHKVYEEILKNDESEVYCSNFGMG